MRIIFFLFSLTISLPLYAETSRINSVFEASPTIVDIQSVNIAAAKGQKQGVFDKSRGVFFVMQPVRTLEYSRSGSGVIVDESGIIVTSAHTLKGASGLIIKLFDGTSVKVRDLWVVPNSDVAFLKIDPPFPLAAISFSGLTTLQKNDSAYTYGHSSFLRGSLIGGRVLNIQMDKNAKNLVNAIWFNFDLEKGDSGSPVLNSRGELLGMVVAGTIGKGKMTMAVPSSFIKAALETYKNLKR